MELDSAPVWLGGRAAASPEQDRSAGVSEERSAGDGLADACMIMSPDQQQHRVRISLPERLCRRTALLCMPGSACSRGLHVRGQVRLAGSCHHSYAKLMYGMQN